MNTCSFTIQTLFSEYEQSPSRQKPEARLSLLSNPTVFPNTRSYRNAQIASKERAPLPGRVSRTEDRQGLDAFARPLSGGRRPPEIVGAEAAFRVVEDIDLGHGAFRATLQLPDAKGLAAVSLGDIDARVHGEGVIDRRVVVECAVGEVVARDKGFRRWCGCGGDGGCDEGVKEEGEE